MCRGESQGRAHSFFLKLAGVLLDPPLVPSSQRDDGVPPQSRRACPSSAPQRMCHCDRPYEPRIRRSSGAHVVRGVLFDCEESLDDGRDRIAVIAPNRTPIDARVRVPVTAALRVLRVPPDPDRSPPVRLPARAHPPRGARGRVWVDRRRSHVGVRPGCSFPLLTPFTRGGEKRGGSEVKASGNRRRYRRHPRKRKIGEAGASTRKVGGIERAAAL